MRRSCLSSLALALICLTAPAAHALPARDIAGVALHPWRLENADIRERAFAGIAATGAHWARVDLRWTLIERDGRAVASDRADWSEMDAIVQAADRHGVELLPILAYVPGWASAEGDPWAYPDAQPFEEFFAAALRRYPQIPAWEIWNEPNFWIFAKPQPDPTGFVELLRSARRTRDRVGSSARLIAGGLASSSAIGFVPWVDEVARQGGLDLVDGLGVHPYSAEEPDHPRAWMMRLDTLHDHLAALGKADLPLWLTEYGVPSMPVASVYAPPLTEEQQAQRLRLAFALATRWAWIENLTWFEYRDGCVDPTTADCNFGLVHADLSPKPAYHALRDAIGGMRTKLRPRLALGSRIERSRAPGAWGARRARPGRPQAHRVTVSGKLLLPGSPRPTTRIAVRLLRRGGRPRRLSTIVRNGVFSTRLRMQGPPPETIEARYRGSWAYEPVVARVRASRRAPRRFSAGT